MKKIIFHKKKKNNYEKDCDLYITRIEINK